MLGAIIGLVEGYLNILGLQVLFADDGYFAVDPDSVVDSWYV
jgi:hypothetical protein